MNTPASIEDYLATVRQTLTELPTAEIQRLVDSILSARAADKQIFVFGNGGAPPAHFACDLGSAIHRGKRRLRVIASCDQIPMISANDADYCDIFVEQLTPLNQDDLVIGDTAAIF
jgi:phosphoheptose isomerase